MSDVVPDWMPKLMLQEEYANWDAYEDALYYGFYEDFVKNPPNIKNRKFEIKRMPLTLGRIATFWHLISSGEVEIHRQIELERCKRIRWPRAILERLATGEPLQTWWAIKNRDRRLHIALNDFSYIVVLADRGHYVLLWTAFYVEKQHRRDGYRSECERCRKKPTK